MNRPSEIQEIREIIAVVEKHRREKKQLAEKQAAIERSLNTRVLLRKPEAGRELATLKVEVSMIEAAIADAEQCKREMAVPIVKYGYALERRLRETVQRNRAAIRDEIKRRVGSLYDGEWLNFVANYSRPMADENMHEHFTFMGGDPAAAELHPSLTPEGLIENVLSLEAGLAKAEARAAAFKKAAA